MVGKITKNVILEMSLMNETLHGIYPPNGVFRVTIQFIFQSPRVSMKRVLLFDVSKEFHILRLLRTCAYWFSNHFDAGGITRRIGPAGFSGTYIEQYRWEKELK